MILSEPRRELVLALFLLTYLGIGIGHVPRLKLNRVGIAVLGAIALLVVNRATAAQAAAWVNWPAMLQLFGFFVLSAQMRLSGLFDVIAARLAAQAAQPKRFLLLMIAVVAGLSSVLNHDIVCYVFTPAIAGALRGRRDLPLFLVALALASNLGASATLIGSAQNILIGEVAHVSFRAYFLWSFVPVVAALLALFAITLLVRPRSGTAVNIAGGPADELRYPLDRAHAWKGGVIFAAVAILCCTDLPKETVVLVAAGIHLASPKFRTEDLLALVDWPVLLLFLSLFVITGAFGQTGYPELALRDLVRAGVDPARPATLAMLTAGATAVMNNAPAVMLLLKIVRLGTPLAAGAMALANGFGGNFLLVSSVSNLIVAQQARRAGVEIGFGTFARLGVPVTLAALGILLLWMRLVPA